MTKEQSNKLVDYLKECTKDEVYHFIRKRLQFEDAVLKSIKYGNFDEAKDHYRFDMTGFDHDCIGSAAINVQNILNKFADLGIYNHNEILVLKFWKGAHYIYYKPINGQLCEEIDGGMGTVDLIYRIFQLTIFSNSYRRVNH